VGFRLLQLALELAQRGVAVDRVLDRRAIERRRLLRHVRDAPVRRAVGVALVGVQLAAQQREQARLAEPFAPIRPVRSPAWRVRSAPSSSGLAPRRKVTWESRITLKSRRFYLQ
jgi:hypothetical protein